MFHSRLIRPLQSCNHDMEISSDLYSSIQTEIAKLSLPVPGPVTWSEVKKNCVELLATHIRDLNVAHYLVIGELELKGIDQLVPSLEFLKQFLESNSKLMRPLVSKTQARNKSVIWFYAAIIRYLDRNTQCVYTKTTLDELINIVEQYGRDISEILTLEVNVPRELIEKLKVSIKIESKLLPIGEDLTLVVRASTTVFETEQSKVDNTASVARTRYDNNKSDQPENVMQHDTVPVDKKLDIVKSISNKDSEVLQACRENLLTLAESKMKLSNKDPSAYYYRRLGAWISLQRLPDSDSTGITQLMAPTARERKSLEDAIAESDYVRCVHVAESLLVRHPLWLEANLITLDALCALGDEYAQCADTVRSLLRDLMDRYPGLRKLKFSKGEMMFGRKCQASVLFSNSLISQNNGTTNALPKNKTPSSGVTDTSADGVAEGFDSELHEQQEQFMSSRGLREEFNSRISQIQLCLRHKRNDLAVAQIEYLWRQVNTINLSTWEPILAAQLIELHIGAITAVYPKGEEMKVADKQRCKELYVELSGVNASAASRLSVSRF